MLPLLLFTVTALLRSLSPTQATSLQTPFIRTIPYVDPAEQRPKDCRKCFVATGLPKCLNLLTVCEQFRSVPTRTTQQLVKSLYDDLSDNSTLNTDDLYCMGVYSSLILPSERDCNIDLGSFEEVVLSGFAFVVTQELYARYGYTICLGWSVEDPNINLNISHAVVTTSRETSWLNHNYNNKLLKVLSNRVKQPYVGHSLFQNPRIQKKKAINRIIAGLRKSGRYNIADYMQIDKKNIKIRRKVVKRNGVKQVLFEVIIPFTIRELEA